MPHRIHVPLRTGHEIRPGVSAFGDGSNAENHYEHWPEERGWFFLFPRYVLGSGFGGRSYRFEYGWELAG